MEEYVIFYRYESWTSKGKAYGEWCVRDSTPRALEDALEKIKGFKLISAKTAKVTKLNYQFKVVSVEEYEASQP